MRVVVCIKQILDPEIPARDFRIDPSSNRVVRGDAALVINPFDENAVEIALRLKDRDPSTTVMAVNLAGEAGDKALRRALSMGCDEALWLTDPLFADLESFGTAAVLARAIAKSGGAEIVLCGRQAGDWDMGQVGALLAEELAMPCLSLVSEIALCEAGARVRRETDAGAEVLEARLPFLATVTSATANQPRYATARGILSAGRKPLRTWSARDLDIAGVPPRRVCLEELTIPNTDRAIEIIDGEDGAEKAARLVERLVELKLI